MKISNVSVERHQIKLKKTFITALRKVSSIETAVIRVMLEDGTQGVGTASPAVIITGDSIHSIEAAVKTILSPALIGKNILSISALSRIVQRSCIGNTSAKAGLEIALFDAYAKRLNMPLYQLLGGKTNTIENDMTISMNETETMVQDALESIGKGFKSLKIKVGMDTKKDNERIKAIREAVGTSIRMRVDANQGWNKKEAVQMIAGWEKAEFKIEFVEQPVPAGDIDSLKYVTERVCTPIMADESVFSPGQALEIVQKKAADWLNIKLMKTGGIMRAMQIADIAEAGGIPCMIGSMMESGPGVLAAAHLACAHPNILKVDLDAPLWLEDSGTESFPFQGPIIHLSEQPGIGYDFFTA
ncbi:dipeptide epimerase [Domibacillus antri]|uniref:Dipeptide epimerase n=1 Tax=Domibacillus antri TaxID=1714264 RepID=A0A1Q8QAB0_9BACI|nr:dipeptide epimerase [Domibacillus antri]OLN24286.1 dipeptide epimerase [Domibacillus antri]